jgi:hypothetical protein
MKAVTTFIALLHSVSWFVKFQIIFSSICLSHAYIPSDPTERKANYTTAETETRHSTVTTRAEIPQWGYFASSAEAVCVYFGRVVPTHVDFPIQMVKAYCYSNVKPRVSD